MTLRIALAGDTMLGRGVAERLLREGPEVLFAPGVRERVGAADAFLVNLECCVSARGAPVDLPGKPFFFRAPPAAARALAELGVDAASLANNHALDYGPRALLDTSDLLAGAGVRTVGAGADEGAARRPLLLDVPTARPPRGGRRGSVRLGVLAATDHPAAFAAGPGRPGVAYAPLRDGVPDWLAEGVRALRRASDVTLVTVHWGPNMVGAPVPHVRRAAERLLAAGADLVVGHSAHVFHGFTRQVLFDLGDFIDDYAVHPALRNDLGLLALVTFDGRRVVRTEAVPLALETGRTRLADPDEYAWIAERLRRVCAPFGTEPVDRADRLTAEWN